MVFKVSFFEKVLWFIATMKGKERTDCTRTYKPNKKFSEVKKYIESGKIGTSMAGRVIKQMDGVYTYEYEYAYDGKSIRSNGGYNISITHAGEAIVSLTLFERNYRADTQTKMTINKIDKEVPDIPKGEKVVAEEIPKVDYTAKTFSELVDEFDKELNAFESNPTMDLFNALVEIKSAMSDKIKHKPVAERAPFSKELSNISMYLDALKMQMNGPNPTQYVGTYVPQMATALSVIAGLLQK